ncbi:hypothetical protein F4561_004731 [Lipingzhangella halophila]|uniref:Uncharacterized protein n=1 Tax=Lipingzhangella halophila TaxID=1783352 RepID=A0A7W7RLY7_9ACTN|nr:hypothetical protein [Lipingzhangella halophila]MBB4933911.1 hypothetical protein [Lipingzhangella halophila]
MRVPAAWALLGAVAAQMLGGLIYIFGADGQFDSSPAWNISEMGSSAFFGPGIVALILGAVFLVVTGPKKPAAFPVVLTSLILAGIGALMGLVTLIMGFVAASDMNQMGYGFATFFETAGYLAILGFAGIFLIRVFGDENLVPRAAPHPPMGQPGYPQGFPPQTGAQQGFAPQTGAQQGFAPQTGAQQSFQQQDWAAQQGYADPNQSYGALGYQQQYADPGQQGYADPNQSYSALSYQQQYADPNQYYADPNQSAYGMSWSQQGEGYAQQSGGQQAYGQDWQYQQQAYDPNQQYQQQAYDPNQQAYGQDWSAEQQMPYAGQPGYASGGQPAGYDAYAYQAYGTGGQPAYGAGEQQAYGTGGQPAYGTGTGGQAAYGGGYDPSAYAPQGYGESGGGDYLQPGEQAAQDAIQYGWYQQPVDQGGERHDTPMEQFYAAEEQQAADPAQYGDPGYAQYGTGAGYGENYPADQQGHPEAGEGQQPWYRDDDRR